MLRQLSIKNLALIDELVIEFGEGLNILTGETGAGKSIIIDAVHLILGGRADRDFIQNGKDFAWVEGLFFCEENHQVNNLLVEYGIQPEADGSLLITRELLQNAKNICRINGRVVTLSMLKTITEHLVDIHGQHEHQSLLLVPSHIKLLDHLGGKDIRELKNIVKQHFSRWKHIKDEISTLMGVTREGERKKDILKYQIDEINNANIREDEETELNSQRNILINSERIINTISKSYEELYEGSGNSSIFDQIGTIIANFEHIKDIDSTLKVLHTKIEDIYYRLEDIVYEIRDYRDNFEYDPGLLDTIEKRLDQIHTLKRKYGNTIEEILNLKVELEKEYELLINSDEKIEQLTKLEREYYTVLINSCEKLSNTRKRISVELENDILLHLKDLGMSKACFRIMIDTPNGSMDKDINHDKIGPDGYDRVEFLFSANSGEPLRPLAKIISGGEMSRVMLAFKTIMGSIDKIDTLIFDEIDVGISGKAAQAVGEKMGIISSHHQIICVTHLPQIASMGDRHYKIHKTEINGVTRTNVTLINEIDRQYEIANMIGGIISDSSMNHAKELIDKASVFKQRFR